MSHRSLIEKIYLLESRLWEKSNYGVFEPYTFDSSDLIKVQSAAKRIAGHLGLPFLTFVIVYTQQKQNIGGHINLDDNKEVFIEIDHKFKYDCNMVLSILAHEICHKYLYINGIQLFPELENEMLTDAATVYTGLGKLSLNGCEKSISSPKIGSSVIKTLTTQKVGYMNREQFAFVYLLVCTMRKTPEQTIISNLINDVILELEYISKTESPYLNKKFFNRDLTIKKVSATLKYEIENSLTSLALFNKNMRLAEAKDSKLYASLYKEYHTFIKLRTELFHSFKDLRVKADSHCYIRNVAVLEGIKFLKSELPKRDKELKKANQVLSEIASSSQNNSEKLLLQFACPSCDNQMRIDRNTLARVKCQRCHYSFIVDTDLNRNNSIKHMAAFNGSILYYKMKMFFSRINS